MEIVLIIILAILAYLLGSIPSSVWVGKAYFGIDVRDYGSGNAGATNTFRLLGTPTGVIVLFLDIVKGLTAASLIHYLPQVQHGTEKFINLQLLFGLLAVVGHILPVYANFKLCISTSLCWTFYSGFTLYKVCFTKLYISSHRFSYSHYFCIQKR